MLLGTQIDGLNGCIRICLEISKKVNVKKFRSPCFFESVILLVRVNTYTSTEQGAVHGGT